MEQKLQETELLLLARRGCLSPGDRVRQTWAVERSALQVGHNISMNPFLTWRHHTEGIFLNNKPLDVIFMLVKPVDGYGGTG